MFNRLAGAQLRVPAVLAVVTGLTLIAAAHGAGTATASAQQADAVAMHQRLLAALNSDDAEAVLALFADDAVFLGGFSCLPLCAGKEALRRTFADIVALKARRTNITVELRRASPTAWTRARYEIRADLISLAGAERIIGDEMIEVRGDQIVAVRLGFDFADPQTAAFIAAAAALLPAPPVPPSLLPTGGP